MVVAGLKYYSVVSLLPHIGQLDVRCSVFFIPLPVLLGEEHIKQYCLLHLVHSFIAGSLLQFEQIISFFIRFSF